MEAALVSYLSSVELLLCLAFGFTPIRLAVLLGWQVWIRRSTGIRISRPLSGHNHIEINSFCTSSAKTSEEQNWEQKHRPAVFAALICVVFCRLSACRCACKYVCAFMTEFMWGSMKQCTALPHQLSYDRPNIAQRKQCFLFSPAWPQSIPTSPSMQHIHPLFPCLSSRDFFSLEKYTLVIIFQCKQFQNTSQEWLAH